MMKKKKAIIIAVAVLLAAAAVCAVITVLSHRKPAETALPGQDSYEDFYTAPTTDETKTGLFYSAFYACHDGNKTRFDISSSAGIPADKITCKNEKAVSYLTGEFLPAFSKKYCEGFSGEFGTDSTDKLIHPSFKAGDTEKCTFSVGKKDKDGKLTHIDSYFLRFDFPACDFPTGNDNALKDNFNLARSEEILEEIKADLPGDITIDKLDIKCDGFKIYADGKRESEALSHVSYVRSYLVTAELSGKKLGKCSISFVLKVTDKYTFEHAGITLAQRQTALEAGESAVLDASVNPGGKIRWSSSDTKTVTVNGNGKIKAVASSDKPVEITASFEYLGNTFTDKCLVYAGRQISSIEIKEKEITVEVDGLAFADCTFSPEDADFPMITWRSSDNGIALVDEAGFVTGIAEGKCEIYAVAPDGVTYDTAKVTVTAPEK